MGKVGVFFMRSEKVTKVAVVRSRNPDEFEELFNARMDELAEYEPQHSIMDNGDVISAVITYQESYHFADSVADEFHAEGIRYLCKHCPHLDDPKDKRIKWCKCKYADLGITHKNEEACELFYKQLKTGKVQPLEDYER